jgi:RNA polymerase sigma factor (sigma-70 family)
MGRDTPESPPEVQKFSPHAVRLGVTYMLNRLQEEIPDEALVRRALAASSRQELTSVFRVIYERHSTAVLRLCGGMLTEPADAENTAHNTFEQAFIWLASGRPLERPELLRAWLYGIARNQCKRQWAQRDRETPLLRIEMSDEEVEAAASRRRRAQVDRMLGTVAATFTGAQQELFRLAILEGLHGAPLANRLGISPEMASRRVYKIIQEADAGFGALVLALDGRPYCAGLARILDDAGWHGAEFTAILRKRIIRHIGQCEICDDCQTCSRTRARLVATYAPITIPILVSGALHERIMKTIRTIADSWRFTDEPPAGSPPLLAEAPGTPSLRTPPPGNARQGFGPATSTRPQRIPHHFQRKVTALAAAGAVLLAVLVIRLTQPGGQPPTAQPVVLTADTTTCPHKTLVYALCFPDSTAASDGGNPLLRRLLNPGEGGVTQVVKRLSAQFSPPSATSIEFFAQEPDPSPLPPPQCFQYDGQLTSDSLAGNSAVETVRAGNAWAELGIVPLTADGASRANQEFSDGLVDLSSCGDLGLSGSGWSVLSAGSGAAGMNEFVLRDVGAIPPAYTGDGVIVQYSEFEIVDDYYIYVTAFTSTLADQLAAALVAKQ